MKPIYDSFGREKSKLSRLCNHLDHNGWMYTTAICAVVGAGLVGAVGYYDSVSENYGKIGTIVQTTVSTLIGAGAGAIFRGLVGILD